MLRAPGASNTATATAKATATALFSYEREEDGDLPFEAGASITVLSQDAPGSGWWTGECGGASGTFPANLVQLDTGRPPTAPALSSAGSVALSTGSEGSDPEDGAASAVSERSMRSTTTRVAGSRVGGALGPPTSASPRSAPTPQSPRRKIPAPVNPTIAAQQTATPPPPSPSQPSLSPRPALGGPSAARGTSRLGRRRNALTMTTQELFEQVLQSVSMPDAAPERSMSPPLEGAAAPKSTSNRRLPTSGPSDNAAVDSRLPAHGTGNQAAPEAERMKLRASLGGMMMVKKAASKFKTLGVSQLTVGGARATTFCLHRTARVT